MDTKLLDRMGPAELRAYTEFLLWHYRVIDGFWFLFVQEKFDQPTAEGINERVWHKAAELAARDFVKRFGIGKGLRGFVQALAISPGRSSSVTRSRKRTTRSSSRCPAARRRSRGSRRECRNSPARRCTGANLPTSPASSTSASRWSASTHRRMRTRRRISASGASR